MAIPRATASASAALGARRRPESLAITGAARDAQRASWRAATTSCPSSRPASASSASPSSPRARSMISTASVHLNRAAWASATSREISARWRGSAVSPSASCKRAHACCCRRSPRPGPPGAGPRTRSTGGGGSASARLKRLAAACGAPAPAAAVAAWRSRSNVQSIPGGGHPNQVGGDPPGRRPHAVQQVRRDTVGVVSLPTVQRGLESVANDRMDEPGRLVVGQHVDPHQARSKTAPPRSSRPRRSRRRLAVRSRRRARPAPGPGGARPDPARPTRSITRRPICSTPPASRAAGSSPDCGAPSRLTVRANSVAYRGLPPLAAQIASQRSSLATSPRSPRTIERHRALAQQARPHHCHRLPS